MVDVTNMCLDTPVKIKITDGAGTWIPELETYTPLESYASIEQVCSIMNRGIYVDFPKQSSNKEITHKIEDILLDYRSRLNEVKKANGYINSNDMETALDVLQTINDSHESIQEELIERGKNIFFYNDITTRIVKGVSDVSLHRVFDSDDFISSEDRIKNNEKMGKAQVRTAKYRKEACEYNTLEADTYRRFSNEYDREYIEMGEYGDIPFKYSDISATVTKRKK